MQKVTYVLEKNAGLPVARVNVNVKGVKVIKRHIVGRIIELSLLTINGNDLVRSVKAGCIRLEHNREQVDLLNVFPVPDGDTGTNMYLTLLSAVKEGEKN